MKKRALLLVLLAVLTLGGGVTYAQTQRTITFRATINPGALLTDVRDKFGQSIAKPVVEIGFGTIANSIDCRAQQNSVTGTLGTDEVRIYVDNPKAAFDGWTLTLAPVNGNAANWLSESGNTFDYNDPAAFGCVDSDGDGIAGLMLVDPSLAKFRSDCLECTEEHLSVGSLAEQSFSDAEAITLLKASDKADELGRWYMTNVKIMQSVPPGQEGDEYSIDMVLTATAT